MLLFVPGEGGGVHVFVGLVEDWALSSIEREVGFWGGLGKG